MKTDKEINDSKMAEDIIGNFNNHDRGDVKVIKNSAKDLIRAIEALCPDGRRKSIAITNVETATMYAVKSLFETGD